MTRAFFSDIISPSTSAVHATCSPILTKHTIELDIPQSGDRFLRALAQVLSVEVCELPLINACHTYGQIFEMVLRPYERPCNVQMDIPSVAACICAGYPVLTACHASLLKTAQPRKTTMYSAFRSVMDVFFAPEDTDNETLAVVVYGYDESGVRAIALREDEHADVHIPTADMRTLGVGWAVIDETSGEVETKERDFE